MVVVENLSKAYGSKQAVDNISFTINDGEIVGFLGPNGAGKSTTMNIIAGYTSSTSGSVWVNGAEILEKPTEVKKQIGYLPEQPPLYSEMTVAEYLSFMYDLKKIKGYREEKARHIAEVCELTKISDVSGRIIKNLSKGYQQRVGIAQALLGKPSILILDEPTVGLDPGQIMEVRNLIKELGREHTVILSSHILTEVKATCDRILVINKGKIVADGTADEISAGVNTDKSLSARISGPKEEVLAAILSVEGVSSVDCCGSLEEASEDYIIHIQEGADVRKAIFTVLAANNWPLLEMKSNELSLEEIFLRLTGGDSSSFENGEQNKDEQETEENEGKEAESK